MQQKDLHDNVRASTALAPQAIASDTTTEGATVDTQGFGSTELLFQAGTLTDGAYQAVVMEADAVDEGGAMVDPTEVDPDDLFGDAPLLQNDGMAIDDSGLTKKVGYNGAKRYVRLDVASTGTDSGGVVGAVAVQGAARNAPVA